MNADYEAQLAAMKDYKAPTAEQGSIEWLMERLGHVTASRFKDVMDFTAKGLPGADRKKYLMEVVIERITGRPTEHWVSKPMQDGTEREPLAKMAYEAKTGRMLTECGFKHHPTLKWVGGSADALIDDRGGFEAKCPTPAQHVATLLGGMPTMHVPQIQGLMWIEARDWWDFASYNPIFPDALQLHIQRIPRDDKYIETLSAGVITFLAEVQMQVDALRAIAAKVAQ